MIKSSELQECWIVYYFRTEVKDQRLRDLLHVLYHILWFAISINRNSLLPFQF